MSNFETEINTFLKSCQEVYSTGHATEHSYRKSLEILLSVLDKSLIVLNEPKRQKVGAPDFILFREGVQIGFLEAKDIKESLNDKKFSDQIGRYQALGNLCFTNNLDWKFYNGEELVGEVSIAKLENGFIKIDNSKLQLLGSYLQEFVDRQSITIKSSKQLAVVMAKKAKTMKEILFKILHQDESDNQESTLYKEFEAFKKILIHDLSIEKFADLYSQTITYGLFTARFYDKTPNTFTRHEAALTLPKSNPFLRKLFQTIAGYDLDERLAWVVDNLVDAFAHTDVNTLMNNFGNSTKMSDPVLHFYETFLGEYDPKTRKATGVYYTPDPVVKFIVNSVDEILKNEFNLPMGLADNSKIKRQITEEQSINRGDIMVERKANNHKQFFEEYHRVQVLDPATGTGTFLLEVFKNIYSKFGNNYGIWQSYAQKDLLPRVHGFELLMASYSMAHLKLAMFLSETGVEINDRLSVYLTNSLEEPEATGFDLFSQWLSQESEEASKIKDKAPVMVVIGNPPYAVSSSNKGEWIQALIKDYKKDLNERKINLDDDYIKFIRYGEHFIEKNGEGVLAYISNNSFIDGITHRQMRKHLLQTFDKVYIIDLHGNSKKKEISPNGTKDENVFDIQQGVSINIFVKTGQKQENQDAKVFHYDIYGDRKVKYEILEKNTLQTFDLKTLQLDEKYKFFVPKNFEESLGYEKGVSLSELFINGNSGIESQKDIVAIQYDKQSIQNIKDDFINLNKAQIEHKFSIKDSRDWTIEWAKADLLNCNLIKINYRPFDTRYSYYSGKSKGFMAYPRDNTMRHLTNNNIGLILKRGMEEENAIPVFISNSIIDRRYWSRAGMQGAESIFPLYLYLEAENDNSLLADNAESKPNFNPELIKQIESELKMNLDWEAGIEQSNLSFKEGVFTPVDLLGYIYAVLHSPSYRQKYKEFLKIDFPRVPFDVSQDKFWDLVEIGSKLRKLHLMEGVNLTDLTTSYPEAGNNLVEKITYDNGKVWINSKQYFEGVSKETWEFFIGGYQPAQKWLKDRKGKELTYDDIIHYQKIIYVLDITGKLQININY